MPPYPDVLGTWPGPHSSPYSLQEMLVSVCGSVCDHLLYRRWGLPHCPALSLSLKANDVLEGATAGP